MACFKSQEQAQAALVIAQNLNDTIVIMPTGGGKTITFSIAASLENASVTMVIYPLVALLQDQKNVFEKMGMKCVLWRSDLRTTECRGSLVLVHVHQTLPLLCRSGHGHRTRTPIT